MMFEKENIVTFAKPRTKRIGMETITIEYEPGSDFAIKLEELIRNSKGVRVVKRKESVKKPGKRCALDEAILEEREGKVYTYESVDDLLDALGI